MLQECLARVSNFSEVLCDNELSVDLQRKNIVVQSVNKLFI